MWQLCGPTRKATVWPLSGLAEPGKKVSCQEEQLTGNKRVREKQKEEQSEMETGMREEVTGVEKVFGRGKNEISHIRMKLQRER